jgi:hypothetical protein
MKKLTVSEFRSQLNRLFTLARRLAETREDLAALNERESAASKQLLDKLIRGDDDGEWIRRA